MQEEVLFISFSLSFDLLEYFFFIIGYLMSWCSFCLQDDYGVSLDPHRPPEPHSILGMHIACAQQ